MRRPDLTKQMTRDRGIQKIFRFKNGYGASVIPHESSFGSFWELAVIRFDGDEFQLANDTPIDPTGGLDDNEVDNLLNQIEKF